MKYACLALLFAMFGACRTAAPVAAALSTARPNLVAISVADLNRSIDWYGKTFGFRVLRRLEFPQHSLRMAFVELNGFQLELIEFKDSVSLDAIKEKFPSVDDRAKVQGLAKLAFSVGDVARAASELETRQAKFVRKLTRDEVTGDDWLIVEDPDGNWIQLFGIRGR